MIDPMGFGFSLPTHVSAPTVRQLMSPAPPTIDQFETVMAAARRIRASGAVWIPVSDERAMFVGMLSDRDIIDRCVAEGHDPRAVTVGSLLSHHQPVVDPDRVADATVLAMIVQQPPAELPVVENGALVGLISVADVAVPLFDGGVADSDADGMSPSDIMWVPKS